MVFSLLEKAFVAKPGLTSSLPDVPAEPSAGLLLRQPSARQLECCDRCFLQINADCWRIAGAVRSATPASLDCRSVWQSEQSQADCRGISRWPPRPPSPATP